MTYELGHGQGVKKFVRNAKDGSVSGRQKARNVIMPAGSCLDPVSLDGADLQASQRVTGFEGKWSGRLVIAGISCDQTCRMSRISVPRPGPSSIIAASFGDPARS